MNAHLQFSPDILKRLGEELVPHADQGLLELAKNAYDADATECVITLKNVHEDGGTIIISDNGLGMNATAIENGWLILGASGKQGDLTKVFKRVPAGNKGLGRLAALRLGHKAILRTRPEDEPGLEYKAIIDWDEYDTVRVVEEVPVSIVSSATTLSHGSDIEIVGLRSVLTKSDVQRLSRDLIMMSDPFGGKTGYHVSLTAPEFSDLEGKVKNAYFGDAFYRLRAELFADGTASFEAFDWKGSLIWRGDAPQTYETVPAVFELWLFILDAKTFSTRSSTVSEVRDWLKDTGGVHIYEDGIRVAPYGGADADWLEMNLMRARSPEERPSTNNTIGRMIILNNDGRLTQKTDRNGYIESEAFFELKRFGQDALKWLAQKRMALAETRRHHEKEQSSAEAKEAGAALEKTLERTVKDPQVKKDIERAVAKALSTTEREKRALREDLQLYRSLATAGMTSAVFSHEISHPIGHVDKLIGKIESKVPEPVKSEIKNLIALLSKAKEKLLAYTRLPLKLLRSEKRRVGILDLHRIIRDISVDYKPVLDFGNIRLELQFAPGSPSALGSIALIEGILANFFANAVKAFDRVGTPPAERMIAIRTEYADECLLITFADSGPGIADIAIEDIWLPGKTTDESDLGTGFGLTIVRDSVKDLGGTVTAKQHGKLGGAEFAVSIPLVAGGAR